MRFNTGPIAAACSTILSCRMTSIFATAAANETGCEVYVSPDSKTRSSKADAISGFIATAPSGA